MLSRLRKRWKTARKQHCSPAAHMAHAERAQPPPSPPPRVLGKKNELTSTAPRDAGRGEQEEGSEEEEGKYFCLSSSELYATGIGAWSGYCSPALAREVERVCSSLWPRELHKTSVSRPHWPWTGTGDRCRLTFSHRHSDLLPGVFYFSSRKMR